MTDQRREREVEGSVEAIAECVLPHADDVLERLGLSTMLQPEPMLSPVNGAKAVDELNMVGDLSDLQPQLAINVSHWPISKAQRRGGASFIAQRARIRKGTATYAYARSNTPIVDPKLYDVPDNGQEIMPRGRAAARPE